MATPCPRCGGELALAIGVTFGRCPYCNTSVARAGDEILERYVVPQRLAPDAARRALDRWMVGNEPSRWLSIGAEIAAPELVWLPVWYARTAAKDDPKSVTTHEGRADDALVPEVKRRLVPPAQMRRLDGAVTVNDDLPAPTRPWDGFAAHLGHGKLVERALVHVPYYRFVYRYRGGRLTAAVDAATGEVRPGRYPRRPSGPFVLLSVGAIATFVVADLWYAGARYFEADHQPHLIPWIYPIAWLASIALARLLTAVF